MKNFITMFFGLFFAALFTVNAGAQDMGMMHGRGHGPMWSTMMQKIDTNKDGKLSRDEWNKHHDDMFTSTDTSKDGFIDEKEMQAHHQSMMGGMMKK